MNALSRAGLLLLVILAVASGIWQLQAAVVAGGVGFIAGRVTAGRN